MLPANRRRKQIKIFPQSQHVFGQEFGLLVWADMFLTMKYVCLEGRLRQKLVDARFASSPGKHFFNTNLSAVEISSSRQNLDVDITCLPEMFRLTIMEYCEVNIIHFQVDQFV